MILNDTPKVLERLLVKEFYLAFHKRLKLRLIAGENGLGKRYIGEKSINRPARALTGYLKHFGNERLQLLGAGEMSYLSDIETNKQKEVLVNIIKKNIPCFVVSRDITPPDILIEVCNEHDLPLFRTVLTSKDFSGEATVLLENEFAPRISMHGTLMDIKGMGTIICGDSGVGKSECALALLERGHSLVSDDVTYLKLINDSEIVGTSLALNKGYMECRGIGIIDIANLYGIRSFRLQKRVDLIITFIDWAPGIDEERTGLDQDYKHILGIDIPHVEIPVRPGRDMSLLVEIAAMVQALKMTGHDSAKEFNDRLIAHMANKVDENSYFK